MMPMLRFSFSLIALLGLTPLPALAVDAACAPFVDAADKSSHQSARQSVMEFGGGERMEAIVVDDVLYSKIGGQWKKLKTGFWAMERAQVDDMRSGKIALTQCKSLGKESVDGIATTVVGFTLSIAGTDPIHNKVYIGVDGLIYAQASDQSRVRYRYLGVRAPEL